MNNSKTYIILRRFSYFILLSLLFIYLFQVLLNETICYGRSRDRYWKSNFLKPYFLHSFPFGDLVIEPNDSSSLIDSISISSQLNSPLTIRGCGSGWYGAGASSLRGGVIIDLNRMNEIKDFDSQKGTVTFQPGIRITQLREACLLHGWDLRVYPPTTRLLDSTMGGFISCGEYGIGSSQYGSLKDYGNIVNISTVTVEDTPKTIFADSYVHPEFLRYIPQSLGTTGVISEITLSLSPAIHWLDACIVFEDYDSMLQMSQSLLSNPAVQIRSLSLFPKSVLTHNLNHDINSPIKSLIPENEHIMIISFSESYLHFLLSSLQSVKAKQVYVEHGNNSGDISLMDYQWFKANDHFQKIQPKNPLTLELHVHRISQLKDMKHRFEDLVSQKVAWQEHFVRTNQGIGCVSIPYLYDSDMTLEGLDNVIRQLFKEERIQKAVNPHHIRLDKIYIDPNDNQMEPIQKIKKITDPKGLLRETTVDMV